MIHNEQKIFHTVIVVALAILLAGVLCTSEVMADNVAQNSSRVVNTTPVIISSDTVIPTDTSLNGQIPDITSSATPVPERNKELTQKSIDEADAQINKVNRIIAWFNSNKSTSSDPEIPAIISKKEIALDYLSKARDAFAGGDYVQADIKAKDAFGKANESYYHALERQDTLSTRFPPNDCKSPPLTFDQVVLALGVGIIPALLATVLYSLTNTIPLPLMNRLLNSVHRNSGYAVFIIAWIVFAITPVLGGIAKEQSHLVAVAISGIWVCLILVLVSMVLITIGSVIVQTIRFLMKRGTGQNSHGENYWMTGVEKTRVVLLIVLLVILTLLMPQVIAIGLKISSIPLLCM